MAEVIVPAVTIFDKDGKPDLKGNEKVIDFLIDTYFVSWKIGNLNFITICWTLRTSLSLTPWKNTCYNGENSKYCKNAYAFPEFFNFHIQYLSIIYFLSRCSINIWIKYHSFFCILSIKMISRSRFF